MLKWDAFGTEITKLALQYAILNGKATFTDLKKNGGREITLSNPQVTGEYVVLMPATVAQPRTPILQHTRHHHSFIHSLTSPFTLPVPTDG
jgi:hypothetical protein